MINPILLLRVIQGVLALIVLGVAAYVVDFFNGASDAANFLVFDVIPLPPLCHYPSFSVLRCISHAHDAKQNKKS